MTGSELRAWRHARELTQREAADRCGVGERSWQRWEATKAPALLDAHLRMIELQTEDGTR